MTTERIKLAAIRTDGGTQTRGRTYDDTVERYGGSMRDGATFPPIVLFFDGTDHWLADGFHRVEASRKEDFTDIAADVRQGTREDAVIFSWSANESDEHRRAALPRTNADKRRAVESALWFYAGKNRRKSDGEIAGLCKVSAQTVLRVRTELTTSSKLTLPTKVTARDGKTYETANTGKTPKRASTTSSAPLTTAMTGAPPIALMPATNMFAPLPPSSGVVSLKDSDDLAEHVAGVESLCTRFTQDMECAVEAVDAGARDALIVRVEPSMLEVFEWIQGRLMARRDAGTRNRSRGDQR